MTQRRSKTNRAIKNAASKGDTTLREFATRDLADDIRATGVAVVVRPQQPTSILLGDDLKAQLRRRGEALGVGYQTVAKMILAKYVNAKL